MKSKHGPLRAVTSAPATNKVASIGKRRRGRPPGSPSLTKQVEDTIVALLRSGATLAAAAAAAGVSPRTVRDWLVRGEDRHTSRKCTPKLRRFAKRVRQAMGEARTLAENRVYEQNARAWLSRTARSTPDDEGWADAPMKGGQASPIGPHVQALSEEELDEAIELMLQVATDRKRLRSVSPKRSRKASA